MAIGGALNLIPGKAASNVVSKGSQLVTHVAAKELSGAATNALATKVSKWLSWFKPSAAPVSQSVQKTAQVAEKHLAKEGADCWDKLSKAGQVLDKEGLTKAGRALDKHGGRLPTVFPKATGNASAKNLQGQFHLDDILTHPKTIFSPNKFGGMDYYIPGGKGVRFNADGSLRGFLQP